MVSPWVQWTLRIVGVGLILVGVAVGATLMQRSAARQSSWKQVVADAERTFDEIDEQLAKMEPVLRLTDWHWKVDSGYAVAEGQVKNISEQRLDDAVATVTFLTESGGFITNGDALIDYNPILPGQISPFKVIVTANQAMHEARIDFRTFLGEPIYWKQ